MTNVHELQPLQPCPPDLVPHGSEGICGCSCGCDLRYQHPGNCAEVSLSGMVIAVMGCARWERPPHDWEDDYGWVNA